MGSFLVVLWAYSLFISSHPRTQSRSQVIVPSATDDTTQPWWVHTAENALNSPATGWVTTTLSRSRTVPPPTGTSAAAMASEISEPALAAAEAAVRAAQGGRGGCFGGGGQIGADQTTYAQDIARDTSFALAGAWLWWRPQSIASLDRFLFGH